MHYQFAAVKPLALAVGSVNNGTKIIRVMINVFHEYFGITFLSGLEVIVGRAESDVIPNRDDGNFITSGEMNRRSGKAKGKVNIISQFFAG